MGDYRAHKRSLLKLDDPLIRIMQPAKRPSKLTSDESNELFQMFSALTDSSQDAESTLASAARDGRSKRHDLSTVGETSDKGHTKSRDKGQGDSAMDFDDEAEMMAAQSLPASPVEDLDPGKGKDKCGDVATERKRFLISKESENVPPVFNYDDLHPIKNVEQPPTDGGAEMGQIFIESDFWPVYPEEGISPPASPPWTATDMLLPILKF